MDQVVFFLLFRCICTVWWQCAFLPPQYLATPAEDSAVQAGRGAVGIQEKEPLHSTADLMFLRDLGPLVLASEMPQTQTV